MTDKKILIGISGFIGCGKDTAANYLVDSYNFQRESFAGALKDAVSVVFGWNRELLEGHTSQSREFRETVDTWWSTRLKIPNLTPRWVLQYWGTDVLRRGFHNDLWIASLEKKLQQLSKVVISDCRFPNELHAIKNQGGHLIWVRRGELPEWYNHALIANTLPTHPEYQNSRLFLSKNNIHASETSWIGAKFDYIIENNSSLQEFYKQLELVIAKIQN